MPDIYFLKDLSYRWSKLSIILPFSWRKEEINRYGSYDSAEHGKFPKGKKKQTKNLNRIPQWKFLFVY